MTIFIFNIFQYVFFLFTYQRAFFTSYDLKWIIYWMFQNIYYSWNLLVFYFFWFKIFLYIPCRSNSSCISNSFLFLIILCICFPWVINRFNWYYFDLIFWFNFSRLRLNFFMTFFFSCKARKSMQKLWKYTILNAIFSQCCIWMILKNLINSFVRVLYMFCAEFIIFFAQFVRFSLTNQWINIVCSTNKFVNCLCFFKIFWEVVKEVGESTKWL